ncbi:Leucine rich repeat-containing protein [Prevotella communis]|uniref:Leucine rich repeat-containing protein n=2 Tax=Prevotella communis TaxID=2913614 RepID=A0A1G7SYB3_9BACT|nr:leucine-rich repeat domain-containing protein [Prevotella communis]SDG28065.1 Leucine rich repeat-containing protein [Prevotella communis]
MIQIKKTILTLVALLAVTTGAWAQGPWTSGDCTVTLSNGTLTVSGTGAMADYDNLSDLPWINNSGDITSVVVESGVTSVGMSAFESLENMTSVTLPEGLTAINDMAFNGCSSLQSITLPEGLTAISPNAFSGCSSLQSITIPSTVTSIGSDAFYSCSDMTSVTLPEGLTAIGGTAFASCSSLTSITIPSTVTSIGDMAFIFCSVMSDVYIYAPSLTTYGADAFNYNATGRKIHVLSDAVDTYKAGWPAYAADFVGDLQPLASGPEVAWDEDKKTGTFTMPGGNVTLEPEYYPQATVADGGVTPAEADARATTDDPLVKVDATKLTGAKKLMYFVSNSGTTAPAYDAEGWTDQLPTAEGFTEAGNVYVWYYPVGTDEGQDDATATYSDGDICLQSITARIAPEPTYAVTFAEGTEESDKWTASPNAGVKKGETVTVTYTGSKKVIGVKAEKKAPAVTVTWNYDDITGTGKSFTKDGVTITAGNIDFSQKNFMNGGTFTTTLGNFTKIEVSGGNCTASGEGWSGDNTKTWTGNASSVSFSGKIHGNGEGTLKFVFTIEPTN